MPVHASSRDGVNVKYWLPRFISSWLTSQFYLLLIPILHFSLGCLEACRLDFSDLVIYVIQAVSCSLSSFVLRLFEVVLKISKMQSVEPDGAYPQMDGVTNGEGRCSGWGV